MTDIISGGKERRLQRRKPSPRGWTKNKRAIFIDHLAATANVSQSAKAAAMLPHSAYNLRRRDAAFARLWAEALQAGYERLEQELLALALGNPDNNIEPGESGIVEQQPPAPIDQELALKLLSRHGAHQRPRSARDGPALLPSATMDEVERALAKKLAALAKRIGKAACE